MAKLRTGEFARRGGFSERLARNYADSGLIPFERDSTGARIFDDSTVELARTIYAQRLANRGRRRA